MMVIKTKHFEMSLKDENDVVELEKEVKQIHRKKREFLEYLERARKIEFAEKHADDFEKWSQDERSKVNLLDSEPLLFEEDPSFSSEPKIPKTTEEFGQFYWDYVRFPIEEVAAKYSMSKSQVVGYHGNFVKNFLIPKFGKNWRELVPTKEDFHD